MREEHRRHGYWASDRKDQGGGNIVAAFDPDQRFDWPTGLDMFWLGEGLNAL
jgi:hypothetical protein